MHRASPAASTSLFACLALAAAMVASPAGGQAAAPGSDALARLHLEPADGGYEAWVDNLAGAAIEVRLDDPAGAVRGDPPLPARATVPAGRSVLLSRLGGGVLSRLRLQAVPGDPRAVPRDAEYLFPLQGIAPRVEQGFGGDFSHRDAQDFYAVDFAAPIGTPVRAARDGVVLQVRDGESRVGTGDGELATQANLVRIAHDDGTMAVYAHLQAGAMAVRAGQRVRAGDLLGRSGDSGFSTGPHLHFAVQVNRDMQLASIPFRMFGPGGILRFSDPGTGRMH